MEVEPTCHSLRNDAQKVDSQTEESLSDVFAQQEFMSLCKNLSQLDNLVKLLEGELGIVAE